MSEKKKRPAKAKAPGWRAMAPKVLIEMEQEGDIELKRDENGELLVRLTPKGEERYKP